MVLELGGDGKRGTGTAGVCVAEALTPSVVVLRSNVTLRNATDRPLAAMLRPLSTLLRSTTHEQSPQRVSSATTVTEEVFENQRYLPLRLWSSQHLLPAATGERAAFSTRDGNGGGSSLPAVPLPKGWRWEHDWKVELGAYRDPDGWSYAADFSRITFPFSPAAKEPSLTDFVRSRRWVRVRNIQSQLMKAWSSVDNTHAHHQLPTLAPAAALELPLDACDPAQLLLELAVRPAAEGEGQEEESRATTEQWSWSQGAANRSTDGPLHVVPSQLQSGTLLMRCDSGGGGSRPFHVMAAVTGKQLRMPAGRDKATDWTVCLQAPLCVHNAMPYAASYVVLEQRRSDAQPLELQRGRVEAFGDVHVHAADMSAPLLMLWQPDGGWAHAEPVAIYLPTEKRSMLLEAAESGKELMRSRSVKRPLASSLQLTHRTHGRLQLRLEYNSDALNVQHHVRVHVPMWLHNLSPFTLSYVLTPNKRAAKDGDAKELREQGSFEVYKTAAAATASGWPKDTTAAVHEVGGQQRVMLDAEFGDAALSLALGASCPSELIPLDQDCSSALLQAAQPDGSVIAVTLSPKQGPPGIPFVLVVEPFVQLYNHTGLPLQVCQPPRADQAVDDACVAAAESVPSTAGALHWVWRRCQHPADPKPHLRLALQVGTSGWSHPLDITTGLHGEDHHIMLPDGIAFDRHVMLHVVKRPVQGSNALELFVQLASPREVPYRVVNWSEHRMSVRQAGLPGASPWYHVEPRSALPFAWAGNPGTLIELAAANSGHTPLQFALASPPPSILTASSSAALDVATEPAADGSGSSVVVLSVGKVLRRVVGTLSTAGVLGVDAAARVSELTVHAALDALSVSLMDAANFHELVVLTLKHIQVRFGRSLGAGGDSLSALSVAQLQLDDLWHFTPYPTMLAHDPAATPFLDLLITQRGTTALNTLMYPFIGVGMDCGALQLRLTESSMWKLFLAGKAFAAALTPDQPAPEVLVMVDPTIEVSTLMTPALSALVWFNAENASQEALGTGTSMSLPNVQRSTMDLRPIMIREEKMAQSKLMENLANNIKKQIVGQVVLMAMGAMFGMLDNASDALGSAGRYMSNLNKVEDVASPPHAHDYTTGDRFGSQGAGVSGALLDGTMSLGKGIVGGVAGVFSKPLKGAQQEGVTGFVKGIQKGVLGVVTSTAGGALQFAAKGMQGVSTAFKQVGRPRALSRFPSD